MWQGMDCSSPGVRISDTSDLAFKGGCNSVSGGCRVTRGLSPGTQFRHAPCQQHNGYCEGVQNPTGHNPSQRAVADTVVKQGLDDLERCCTASSGQWFWDPVAFYLWIWHFNKLCTVNKNDWLLLSLQLFLSILLLKYAQKSFICALQTLHGFLGVSLYILKHRSWTLPLLRTCVELCSD